VRSDTRAVHFVHTTAEGCHVEVMFDRHLMTIKPSIDLPPAERIKAFDTAVERYGASA